MQIGQWVATVLLGSMFFIGLGANAASSSEFAIDTFNTDTSMPALKIESQGAAVARAQILLDRAWFSCGEIDGVYGKNMERMVSAYQSVHGLKPTGELDEKTWQSLQQDSKLLLTTYTITEEDAKGPFLKIPEDLAERAKMEALPYTSLAEMLGEKFHIEPKFLQRLNPDKELKAGATIVVPNVRDTKGPDAVATIEVDKSERVLFLLAKDKTKLAGFPISMGGENDPLPVGVMTIKNIAENPNFTYDPALMWDAKKDAEKVIVPPGPNNPVGVLWMGLSKEHWGIHGTPEPGHVGHSESHGCIHLTNWDARRVAEIIKLDMEVEVKP